MAILTFPDARFMRCRFGLVSPSRVTASPFTGSAQTLAVPGAVWRARFEVAPQTRFEQRNWIAWLAELQGVSGRFYGRDVSHLGEMGLLAIPDVSFDSDFYTWDSGDLTFDDAGRPDSLGTPVVEGASQTGVSLATSGWDAMPDGRAQLLRGDYLSFHATDARSITRRSMHMVTADTTADVDGLASVPIVPPIRWSPADQATISTGIAASCIMRLTDPDQSAWDFGADNIAPIVFEAIEHLTDVVAVS